MSTDRVYLEIEHIFDDAENDVLRHTITVDCSGQPFVPIGGSGSARPVRCRMRCRQQGESVAQIRNRSEVLGFGVPALLFLPGVAHIGITNGHQFIANDFFAFMYCLVSVGFVAVPLLAWRRGGGRYADPGFVRSAWFPWLFTTMQGVAYSSPRGDSNVFMLIFGWGMFIYAGMVALYFLGNALWGTGSETSEAVPDEGSTGAELHEPKAGA